MSRQILHLPFSSLKRSQGLPTVPVGDSSGSGGSSGGKAGFYNMSSYTIEVQKYDASGRAILSDDHMAVGSFVDCDGLAVGDLQDNYFTSDVDAYYNVLVFNFLTGEIISNANVYGYSGYNFYDYYRSDFDANVSIIITDGIDTAVKKYLEFYNVTGHTFHLKIHSNDDVDIPFEADVAPGYVKIRLDDLFNVSGYEATWSCVGGDFSYKFSFVTEGVYSGNAAETTGDSLGLNITENRTIILS